MIFLKHVMFWTMLAGCCDCIFENCDYYEELLPNKSYFVYSPNYPENYSPGKTCRWYAVSPSNTRIHLTCEEFKIPLSQKCHLDQLLISRNGSIDLSDAKSYCGNGQIKVVSDDNKMNIALLTVSYSPGGSFFCEIGFKRNNQSPVPPPKPHCSCGHTNSRRIVGGTETGVNEYPMMAGLVDGVERALFCGATIISHKYALTAAHCVYDRKPWNLGLLVGEHDISTGNDTKSAKIYLLEKYYMHPMYNSYNYKNDIALVRVRDQIQFNMKVGSVCLPFLNTKDSFAGETVYALGWGTTEYLGPTSDKLLQAPLDVITTQQCETFYRDITEKHMCTYKDNKDACQTDSGGPLLWRDPNSHVVKILGIISYGKQCASHHPSVNTRVTSYLNWIKHVTGEEYCKI